ncbi:Pr6Pr family membrane protein [Herbiconiux moechotypicola]|uniref:Integral membrane protein n=1 Tax=Herbiconiux moechotypicola TaxID=637393 RepID=A0ABP5QYD9_9MICO|nr:Pr6Pr family membrane protein [Herbiconiux moechotypicola]MCS5731531.1 Pr6Pr family membrane protein [Herbiconiux moechotypicola]
MNPQSPRRAPRALAVSRVVHLAVAGVVAASIGIQLVLLVTGGADANSGETGEVADLGTRLVRLFLFFTIDSNLVVAVVSIVTAVNPFRPGFWWNALRLNALVAITVTGVVYMVLLAPAIHIDGWALVSMVGLHVVSPIGFVAAWLVFGPRPRFDWATVAAAFVLPVAWLAVTFIRGAIVDWYPYPFLDVRERGLPAALMNALLILVAAAVLAVLFRLVDAKLPSALRDR